MKHLDGGESFDAQVRRSILTRWRLAGWLILSCAGCDTFNQAYQQQLTQIRQSEVEIEGIASKLAAKDALEQPAAPPQAEFVYPHPNRSNPFAQPMQSQEQAVAPVEDERRRIHLRGFADVDGVAAILVIDGDTLVVRPGDRHDGIHVLAVQPPRIILMRDGVKHILELTRR